MADKAKPLTRFNRQRWLKKLKEGDPVKYVIPGVNIASQLGDEVVIKQVSPTRIYLSNKRVVGVNTVRDFSDDRIGIVPL